MSYFEARSVTKKYAHHLALDKVSINVPKQSIYGLLGPNGAGKTSLIRIINQITAPDEGELWLNGHKLKPSDTALIGYLPEERGLYKKMKVGEQALYLAQLKGIGHAEAKKRLTYWFEKFDIMGWWSRKVEELSKGMQQKIQFVVTIIHEPELLIFDEPFSGFDPINVNLLKDEILNLRKNGSTIIFSTHNMASVEELCENIALIHNGKKVLEGRVNDIRKQHRTHSYELTIKELSIPISQFLPDHFSVSDDCLIDENMKRITLKSNGSEQPNELLNLFTRHGEVMSFSEILPTMNEIFIDTVNRSKLSLHE
ncbi:MAG: ATP-binding cassette domain-containing protein [Bacteroidales bacterium]|nr:ATP-binding cassette domain-containing protein [Bacteroidales bacterium]